MESKIKIVFILEATLGGIRKNVVELLDSLDTRQYQLFFIYSTLRADAIFMSHIKALEDKGVMLFPVRMVRNVNVIDDVKGVLSVYTIVKKIAPDIIHVHGAKAGIIGRIASLFLRNNVKVIYTPHGGSFHMFDSFIGMVYLAIEKCMKRFTDMYIGVSKDSHRHIVGRLHVNEKKCRLIYHGIKRSESGIAKTEIPNRSHYHDRFIVLHPALFLESKGHLEYLEAIGKNNSSLNAKILILLAGDGPLRNDIIQKIEKYNLSHNIELIGFTEDLNSYIEISDLIMLPSQNEAFGYVLLEAMMHSKPVLGTIVGSIPEIIQNGHNGILISLSDIDRIVEILNYHCDNMDQLRIMGKNGHQFATTNFRFEKMIEEHDALYKELVSRS